MGDAGVCAPWAKSLAGLLHSTSALDARNSRNRFEIHPLKYILSSAVSSEGGCCRMCRRCTNRLMQYPIKTSGSL